MLARHVLSVWARLLSWGGFDRVLLWIYNQFTLNTHSFFFFNNNPAITRLPLLIWKSAISVVVWLNDEVLGSAVVWLMKPVMWTDFSQLCNTCQCVNSWDMLSTLVTLTTSIYAVELVRLWRDEARPSWAQKVGQIAIIEFTLGDLD